MYSTQYLIIGAGPAGVSAANAIRDLDKENGITILTGETTPIEERGPISEAVQNLSSISPYVKNYWERLAIDIHINRRAISIDPDAHMVHLQDGDPIHYEKLLLAQGGRPKNLPGAEQLNDRVCSLRTYEDYQKLLTKLENEPPRELLIIGGSFIAIELATTLQARYPAVALHLAIPGSGPLSQVLPFALSASLVPQFEEKGIHLHTFSSLQQLNATSDGRITAGRINNPDLTADFAVAAIGIELESELAQQANIHSDDGILVDDHMRTSAADIYAAGDIARYPSPLWPEETVRTEHLENALATGHCAGRNMAGKITPFTGLCTFKSQVLGNRFISVGETSSALTTYMDISEELTSGAVFYLKEGLLRGILLWNNPQHVECAQALIRQKRPVSIFELKGKFR